MIHFEPNINISTLIAAAAFYFTVRKMHTDNQAKIEAQTIRFNKMEEKVNLIWNNLKIRFNFKEETGEDE